jgi:hypothetical protein
MSYTFGRAMRISGAGGQSLTANPQAFHVMRVRRHALNALDDVLLTFGMCTGQISRDAIASAQNRLLDGRPGTLRTRLSRTRASARSRLVNTQVNT